MARNKRRPYPEIRHNPHARSAPASSLLAWWDAGEGLTASGGVVTTWQDLSGHARHATPHGSPGLLTNAINGHPAVTFAPNAYLRAPSPGPLAGEVVNLFVVARFTALSAGAYPRLIDWGDGTNSAQLHYDADAVALGTKNTVWQPDTPGGSTTWFTPTAGTWYLIAVTWDGTGAGVTALRSNGTAQTAHASTNGNAGSQDAIYLGARSDLPSVCFLTGAIAEVRCYKRLTTAQAAEVTRRLRAKYAL